MSHLRHRTIFLKLCPIAPPYNLQETAPGAHFYRWLNCD